MRDYDMITLGILQIKCDGVNRDTWDKLILWMKWRKKTFDLEYKCRLCQREVVPETTLCIKHTIQNPCPTCGKSKD